jgi:hypothetical protein
VNFVHDSIYTCRFEAVRTRPMAIFPTVTVTD